MKPLFFTLDQDLPVMIIPDTQAHLDGHEIITHTYSIYLDVDNGDPRQSLTKETLLHVTNHTDPDYFGFLTFEKPGKLFTYTANGQRELDDLQVNELIEKISTLRDDPSTWGNILQ